MKKFYIISGLIILLGSLNYAGVCIPKGRFLTNEEKFLAVLEYHNNRVTVPYWVNEGYPRQIKYESVQKYLKENPNCCWTGGGEECRRRHFLNGLQEILQMKLSIQNLSFVTIILKKI